MSEYTIIKKYGDFNFPPYFKYPEGQENYIVGQIPKISQYLKPINTDNAVGIEIGMAAL